MVGIDFVKRIPFFGVFFVSEYHSFCLFLLFKGDNGLEKLRPIQKKVLITNVSGAYSTFELKQHTADLQKEIKEEFEEHTRQFETKLKYGLHIRAIIFFDLFFFWKVWVCAFFFLRGLVGRLQ
jgi:hypothetical protein